MNTLALDEKIVYREIPRFTPECFAWLQSTNTGQFKRFREGLDQWRNFEPWLGPLGSALGDVLSTYPDTPQF